VWARRVESPTHPSLSQEELIKWQTQVRETEKRPTTKHTSYRESEPLGIHVAAAVSQSERKRDEQGGGKTTILNNVVMDYSMASMADGYRYD
jgi:hypothetical protein